MGFALGLIVSACATYPEPQRVVPVANPAVVMDDVGWWYISFHMDWPEDADPAWYRDAWLADRVVAPVLDDSRLDIVLWRFHRRAARDNAGHRFSFIFRASAPMAARINQAIAAQPALQRLLAEGAIERVSFDDPQHNTRPHIEDTSDKSWPPSIQKTWPSFIMGASRMWLDLVHHLAAQQPQELDADSTYRAVQKEISGLWRFQGQHALLHHLNALYGYEEMLIIERTPMRF